MLSLVFYIFSLFMLTKMSKDDKVSVCNKRVCHQCSQQMVFFCWSTPTISLDNMVLGFVICKGVLFVVVEQNN